MPCRIFPESPRWLLVKGKVEETKHVLRYAADMNKRTIPLSLLDKVRGLAPSVGQGWGCGRASSHLILSGGTLAQRVSPPHCLKGTVAAKSNPIRGRPDTRLALWGQVGLVGL